LLLHPDAALSDAEQQALATGLDRTLAGVPSAEHGDGGGEGHGHEEDDD